MFSDDRAPQDRPTTRLADRSNMFSGASNTSDKYSRRREGNRRIHLSLSFSSNPSFHPTTRGVSIALATDIYISINMRSLSRYIMYPAFLVVFLFSHGSYFGPQATVSAATVVAEDLEIDNVEECLDCTKSGCWYCELQCQFTLSGDHFSMCYCSPPPTQMKQRPFQDIAKKSLPPSIAMRTPSKRASSHRFYSWYDKCYVNW
jgi:hypothetical protein